MKRFIKRTFTMLLCVSLLLSDNVTHIFASETIDFSEKFVENNEFIDSGAGVTENDGITETTYDEALDDSGATIEEEETEYAVDEADYIENNIVDVEIENIEEKFFDIAQGEKIIQNPRNNNGVVSWDCVYFGSYWQSDTNGDGVADEKDTKEPIKWRVLSVDGNDMFLLSEKSLDNRNQSNSSDVKWEDTIIRSWLNGYSADNNIFEEDCTTENFITQAFNINEIDSIITNNEWNDKILLPTEADMCNEAYGFDDDRLANDEKRITTVTEYGHTHNDDKYWGEYWVISQDGSKRCVVSKFKGKIVYSTEYIFGWNSNIRPVIHIKLDSDMYRYAGMVSSDGETIENPQFVYENLDFFERLPTLSPEDAKMFLCFAFNSDKGDSMELSEGKIYKLLIGDYSCFGSVEEIQANIYILSTLVRTQMDRQIGSSTERLGYLTDDLVSFFKGKISSSPNISQEIVSSYENEYTDYIREGVYDFCTQILSPLLGNFVSLEYDAVSNAIDGLSIGITGISSSLNRIESFTNNIVASVEGYMYIRDKETLGRCLYFNSYLSNRGNYISKDDDIFRFIMDYNFMAAQENGWGSSLVNVSTWITGKDSFANHRDDMDRWAENLFLLEQMISYVPNNQIQDENSEIVDDHVPYGNGDYIPKELWITNPGDEKYIYTGGGVYPKLIVHEGEIVLTEGVDYTITYKNNVKAYTLSEGDEGFDPKLAPTILIKSKGNYSGTETVYFTIQPADISEETFVADSMAVKATGKAQKPVPTLLFRGKSLASKNNYSISYYRADAEGKAKGEALTGVTEAGKYVIRLTGIGTNFVGTKDIPLTVLSNTPVNKLTVAKIKDKPYTGSAIVLPDSEIVVKNGKTVLSQGVDYTVTYFDNVDVGKASVLIEGKGEYAGSKRINFNIIGTAISKATVEGITSSVPYTGNDITFDNIRLYIKATKTTAETTLEQGIDYTVSYSKNQSAGTATVLFNGINGYTGTVKKTFKITPYKALVDDTRISVSVPESVKYSKGGAKPAVTVKFVTDKGTVKTLAEKTDYTLTYSQNTSVNDCSNPKKLPTVKVTLKGSYSGSISKNYAITQKNIGAVSIRVNDKIYQNKKNMYASAPVLTDTDGNKLAAGKDYDSKLDYTYKNETTVINANEEVVREAGDAIDKNDIIPAGTTIEVTAIAKAGGNYCETVSGEYRITKSSISSAKATVPAQIYSGAPITLTKDEITLKVGKDTLTSDDFEIVEGSYKNNVKKGTASVTVKGVGNYGGTKTVNFTIKTKTFIWWWKYDTKLITGADFYTVYFGVNGSLEDDMYIENIEEYTVAQYKAVTKNKSKWRGAVVVGYKTKKTKYAVATEEVGRVVYD